MEQPDLIMASPQQGVTLPEMIDKAVTDCRYYEYAGDIHEGVTSYATECLWPALGALALRLRDSLHLTLDSGYVLEADGASPRFRTDFLLTHPDESRAWHIFICHRPDLNEAGKADEANLQQVSTRDIVESILNPSPEEIAVQNNPANYDDPTDQSFVERIGGTMLRLAPKDGFATFRPAKELEEIWWPDMALNMQPSIFLARLGDKIPTLHSGRTPRDPYTELKLMQVMCEALEKSGLGPLVSQRNATLQPLPWIQFGDEDCADRISAGMRMVNEASGYVTQDVIDAMALAERRIYAGLMERQIDGFRKLARDLVDAGHIDDDKSFDANDMRDMAWADTEEGFMRLHARNQSGYFTVEFRDDESIRILKGRSDLKLIEALVPGDAGLRPSSDLADMPVSIRTVRDRNSVLNSLSSVACQFEPQKGEDPTP